MSKQPQSNCLQADIQNTKLLDLKNRFSIALKAARIGIHDYDVINNSVKWDERIREIWGTDLNESITYETFISGVHPEDRIPVQEEMNKALDPKIGEFFLEYRVINRKDKAVRWVHATGQTLFQDNRPIRLIGTAEDISERKKAEKSLEEAEERFRGLVESTSDIFWQVDEKAFYTYVSPKIKDILGYESKEIIGKTFFDLVDEKEEDRIIDAFLKIANNKEPFQGLENCRIHKNGSHVLLETSGVPILDKNGQLMGYRGIDRDITESKKVEEELKESEQLYKTIFDNGDDGFVLVEPIFDENNSAIDILFLQLNFAYEQQTGTKAAKVKGKRGKEVAPNLEQEWIFLCGEVAKTGKTRRIESYNQRTNKWYDATYIPFTKGRVGILFRDVTERKNMEKQLKNSERLAAIGETAGMVGHDIRNPLQAIVGDVYLLKDFLLSMPEMPTKRDVAESLEEIEKNISYINKIVADLQDYSKTIRPEYCNVNLYDLIISIFRPIAIPDDVNPLIEVDPTIILRTDSALFTRIITNLVINAIQAMPKGGKLVIQALKNDGKIVLSVEDTGVGIPEEIKPKLFTPMVTTKSKGQGLGLAVVKRLVEALNGTVVFESWEGKGTKFIIELPSG